MFSLMNRFPWLVAATVAFPLACQACAAISFDPDDVIRTTGESALIAWNAKTGVEHFVRRASFQTRAKNFGFLVPTPTRPEIGVAKEALFWDLEDELRPKTQVVVQRGVDFTPFLLIGNRIKNTFSSAASNITTSAADEGVEVVEQKRVGDYNASVLRASDSASLLDWLKKHRYTVTPETRDWLAPYVKEGFFITAFQIAADSASQSAQADAVRLSFQTPAPFYPYREPKSAQKIGGGRSLRVFLVSNARMDAQIQGVGQSAAWPATTTYSAPLDSQKLRAHGLNLASGPLRLTAFEDLSSPRPGFGDLKFAPSADQSEKTPPPNIIYRDERKWIPFELVALVGALMIWGGTRFRRARDKG